MLILPFVLTCIYTAIVLLAEIVIESKPVNYYAVIALVYGGAGRVTLILQIIKPNVWYKVNAIRR